MKRLFSLAATIGTLFLLAACGGGEINPDNGGGETPDPKPDPDKPYVDGSTTIGGHEALDLGTGILWATTNLGATQPQDYGKYYSWGEVQPKSEYRWSNYKWSDGVDPENYSLPEDIKMTKYCLYKAYGTKDDRKVLEKEDDAAYLTWGPNWRMPTRQEVQDLLDKCDWEWNRVEGLYGYKISSKKTGKSIFLPAAGAMTYKGPNASQFMCNYWTSSLHDRNEQYYAYAFVFLDEGQIGTEYISQTYRYLGMTIRAVSDKKED